MGKKPRRSAGKVRAARRVGYTAARIGSTLSLSQVAAELAAIAPDVAGTTQQIRHWTREGVLQPVEMEHYGPGRHRQYTGYAVYCAAVLRVLTIAGLPISHSRFLKDLMCRVDTKANEWNSARDDAVEITLPLMIVGVTAAGATQVAEERLKDERGFKVADAVLKIEIDLTKLFTKVDRGRS